MENFGSRRLFLQSVGLTGLGITDMALAEEKPTGGIDRRTGKSWTSVLKLDSRRQVTFGNNDALCAAIRQGAQLRISTEFIYNEHVDTSSDNSEPVHEVSDFPVTYLVEDRWVAGIMSQRMPISPPEGFGPRASMSFFMYNQNGQQAIARPYLDGPPVDGPHGPSTVSVHPDMPKYHLQDSWDSDTNAPSSNFIYDFNYYNYIVRDDWEEVYSHTAKGEPVFGKLDTLYDAFMEGREVKVGIRGLCDDLTEGSAIDHTVFVQTGPGYYCTERKLFCAGTQPVVRVRPEIPMLYTSDAWDFGWLMPRTDGFVDRWLCNPYTLQFHKSPGYYAIRWFVR